jgi:nucleoside-diphosphate-sugar epimerase
MESILVIGSNGQIGTELIDALKVSWPALQVISCDIRPQNHIKGDVFEQADVNDRDRLKSIFEQYQIRQVYLLAALLSATGETNPRYAWDLNINGLLNVLDLSVAYQVEKVFWPSSIAVFGPDSPKEHTPQFGEKNPQTVYGFSKLAGEHWCNYYREKYQLDVRSIRYPGLISWKAAPGGGTTDYAVQIFHDAIASEKYHCFLSAGTKLPMMYMDDAIRGTIELMQAPIEQLKVFRSYNLAGFSCTPQELAAEISKYIPDFTITYQGNDPRQQIADSWPWSIDDDEAKKDWGWNADFNLTDMTGDMIRHLSLVI